MQFRYLGCIEVSELSATDQVQHAFLLGLAALLGEGVYNLGELVSSGNPTEFSVFLVSPC